MNKKTPETESFNNFPKFMLSESGRLGISNLGSSDYRALYIFFTVLYWRYLFALLIYFENSLASSLYLNFLYTFSPIEFL